MAGWDLRSADPRLGAILTERTRTRRIAGTPEETTMATITLPAGRQRDERAKGGQAKTERARARTARARTEQEVATGASLEERKQWTQELLGRGESLVNIVMKDGRRQTRIDRPDGTIEYREPRPLPKVGHGKGTLDW